MLSYFRKHAGSPWAKALYIFIAVTFFGGFGMLSSGRFRSCVGGPAQEGDVVAVVDGVDVTYGQLVRSVRGARENWLRMMSQEHEGDIPLDIFEGMDFKSEVMDQIVEDIVLHNTARRWGVKVTDAEVREEIGRNPYFQDRLGRFSRDRYLESLPMIGMTESMFEERTREWLLLQKMSSIVGGSAKLLEGEARERYIFEQEKINLEYLLFDIDERYKDAEATEEEVQEYYEDNRSKFDLPETRKIRFFRFHVPDYEGKVKLTDEMIRGFYEDSKERYLLTQEKAIIRYILIKAYPDMTEDQLNDVKALAEDLANRAREGADFAELARTYSEDPNTKENGGYAGEVMRGMMPYRLDEAIFSLEPGGVSDPVFMETAGFYILMLEGKTPAEYKPLEDVEEEVKETVLRTNAFAMATQDASTVEREINEGKALEEIADERGIKLYTSEFFRKDERNAPDIPDMFVVAGEAFFLEKGRVSDVISGLDDLYIIELTEIGEPHQASLDESRSKIIRILGPEIKKKRAMEEARGFLEELKQGADMKTVAKRAGLEWRETGLFPRAEADIPGVGYSEDLKVAAFSLGPDQPWPEDVYEVARQMVILHFIEKEEADMAAFEENPKEFEQKILTEKQKELIENFKETIKKDAVTYQDLYEKMDF